MKKFSSLATVVVFSLSLAATATHKASADQNEARSIITNQLESFIARDYGTAYTYASPDIKRLFPTLDRFVSMVQSGYDPVLRPGNYSFGRVENLADGRILQEVLIRAPDGSDWTAVYFMERQDDGSWKVDGVSLNKGAAGLT